MKKQSYQKVIDKDIIEVKQYLLDISEGYWMQDIHDLINISMDVKIIRKKLMRRKDLELAVFSKIKKLIDQAQGLNEMENHLIMMNLLLDKHYSPMLTYKYKLLNYIIENGGFSIDTYCLLRHLIKFTNNNLNDFIMALATRLNFSNERYHYLASHILLLEKQYKKVYNHLEYITIDERLGRYLPALYNFSPRLYNKYARMMYIPLNLAIM